MAYDGTIQPNLNREPCVQQMSCADGYYWSQRHCNCMTNEELTGPYDFGGPRLANPNGSDEIELNRRNAQGQTAPEGYHYMPDGTLMSDADHARLSGGGTSGCVKEVRIIENPIKNKQSWDPVAHWSFCPNDLDVPGNYYGTSSNIQNFTNTHFISLGSKPIAEADPTWDPNCSPATGAVYALCAGGAGSGTPAYNAATINNHNLWRAAFYQEVINQIGPINPGDVIDTTEWACWGSEEHCLIYHGHSIPTTGGALWHYPTFNSIVKGCDDCDACYCPPPTSSGWDCVTTTPNIGEVSPDNLFNTFGGISQCVERFTPQTGAFPTQQACVASCGSGGSTLPHQKHKIAKPGDTMRKVTNRGNKKIDGWVLTPNGNYITEDVFIDTYSDRSEKVITKFKLNLADLTAATETRSLEIIGDSGASFVLEIKNADGNYYNFYTKTFTETHSFLDEELEGSSYINEVVFPASGSDDQYDVFLHAKPGTKHVSYIEKRFGDDSIDLNGSIGSNSLLLQKVIYQYNSKLRLTLSGYSVSGDITATMGTTSVEIDRYKEGEDTAFSFTTTAASTAAFRVLKQPSQDDIISFIQPTLASVPATLQGENIYPTVTGTDTVNMPGGRSSSGVAITMDSAVATKMAVGDRVTGNAALNAGVFTVVSLDSTNIFSISSGVAIDDGATLSFSNQVNYSWPVNNYVNLIQDGMIVLPGTNIPVDTRLQAYSDKTTTSPGTKEERTIVSKTLPAVSTKGLKPTVVKGLVTNQAGDIIFSNQLPISLGGTAIEIGGYGESEVRRLYGWDVEFTDLKIALTAPTATTSGTVSNSSTITVNNREGVINNVSRVGGVGINPALQNPLITAGGGATESGDWTVDGNQTLESGITLTVENTGRVATITGNMRINRAGNASQTLRFDVDKLLSTSA